MRLALSLTLLVLAVGTADAAKATRFWNLTANTVTSLELAPAGTQTFGADQAKNDKDGAVDHDERLKVTDVTSGTYDVRLADAKGRTCVIKNVVVQEGDVFSIDEKQLADCAK
jgi:hypothetical protein